MKINRWLILIILILIGTICTLTLLLEHRSIQSVTKLVPIASPDENQAGKLMIGVSEMRAGELLAVEERVLEPSFSVSLAYDKYLTTYTYFYVEKESIDIFSGPSMSESIIRKVLSGERLNYIESVYIVAEAGVTEQWMHVTWKDEGESRFGFVNSVDVTERLFQFDKMEEAIVKAENFADKGHITYISNYQNRNGYAPLYKGQTIDAEGNRRSQSAPGYPKAADKDNFIYIEDGTLVLLISSDGDYAKVQLVHTEEIYYVPVKYIATSHRIHDLTRVIAIDVTNQNEAVYEKKADGWSLISYTQATTGTSGRYSRPTPVGFYFGMEKREYFHYYEDGTTKIHGYAPYAIRFAGGAYVHGVAVSYKYNPDGTRITPPMQEYSKTIGTVPLSHKCVRNYTSHAKFLYDWFSPGETIIIVID